MWYYKNKIIDDISKFPENAFGFIYKITNLDTDKFYIGKKNLYTKNNIKLGKKELAAEVLLKKPGKKKTKKLIIKESDWIRYYGSEPTLKEDVKQLGPEVFKREILMITYSTKQTTYQEVRHQILHNCLESDNCYNNQILGKFWRKDI